MLENVYVFCQSSIKIDREKKIYFDFEVICFKRQLSKYTSIKLKINIYSYIKTLNT